MLHQLGYIYSAHSACVGKKAQGTASWKVTINKKCNSQELDVEINTWKSHMVNPEENAMKVSYFGLKKNKQD